MNNDYLWDKSGNDAEIERLEDLLRTFSYQETAAPVLLVERKITLAKPSARSNFRLAFAFAALLTGAFSSVLWFQFRWQNDRSPVQTVVTEPVQNNTGKPENITSPVTLSKATETKEITHLTPQHVSFVPIKRPVRKISLVAKRSSREKRQVTLTDEEKYAYGRLMLALSITSSKLKVVTDTINRTED